jgi:cytosine/adenosine deaminase-related metal-dependent hydrolase
VRGVSATPTEIQMVKASAASVSVLHLTEMVGGWGFPQLYEFMTAGVPVALGIDTAVLGGAVNMFKLMQFAMAACNVQQHNELALTARRALELGSIGGAKVLGKDDQICSLTPGKRADLILVSTDNLSMGVISDPAAQIVQSAMPSYVDTVIVDGRVLKRRGRLTAVNTSAVVANARAASAEVRARMNYG